METKVQQDLRLSPKGAPELGFKLGLVDSGSTRCFPSHLSAPKSVGKALSPLSKPMSETSGRGSLFHEGVCGGDMSAFCMSAGNMCSLLFPVLIWSVPVLWSFAILEGPLDW